MIISKIFGCFNKMDRAKGTPVNFERWVPGIEIPGYNMQSSFGTIKLK